MEITYGSNKNEEIVGLLCWSLPGHLQCWMDLLESWHWQIYMSLISITVFFIPACIIATCYSIIIYTIWSKTNILSQNKMSRHPVCEYDFKQCPVGVVPRIGLTPVRTALPSPQCTGSRILLLSLLCSSCLVNDRLNNVVDELFIAIRWNVRIPNGRQRLPTGQLQRTDTEGENQDH